MANTLTHPDTIGDLIPFVSALTVNKGKHHLLATSAKLSKLEMRIYQSRDTLGGRGGELF